MHCAVIAGSRHRGYQANVRTASRRDRDVVHGILAKLKTRHGDELVVCSVGCDAGIGSIVRYACCHLLRIRFVEARAAFPMQQNAVGVPVPVFEFGKDEKEHMLRARNAMLAEIGREYFIFVADSRESAMEDLVQRVKTAGLPFVLYDEANNILDASDYLDAAVSVWEAGEHGQKEEGNRTAAY